MTSTKSRATGAQRDSDAVCDRSPKAQNREVASGGLAERGGAVDTWFSQIRFIAGGVICGGAFMLLSLAAIQTLQNSF